jgi:hypothetical protein
MWPSQTFQVEDVNMANGAGAAAAAGAAHAAIANAIKASGAIVRLTPGDFTTLVSRATDALVVQATAGIFSIKYRYLLSYKGFVFYTQTPEALQLPATIETVRAQKIWVPD